VSKLNKTSVFSDALHGAYALRFADSVATTTLVFAVPLMVYASTHSAAWSGVSFLLEWVPRLTAMPVAGPLVDRFGSCRIFIVTNSFRLVMSLATFAALAHYPHAWFLLVILAVVCGMCAQASFVAAEHMGMSVTGTHQVHRVQAVQVGIDQSVLVLGPLFAGVLLAIDKNMVFIAVATLALGSITLAARLARAPLLADHTKKLKKDHNLSILEGIVGGLRIVKTQRPLMYATASAAAYNLLLGLVTAMMPAFVSQHFGRGSSSVSLLWTIAAIASILMVIMTGRIAERIGITRFGAIAAVTGCLAIAAASFAHSYKLFVLCVTLFIAMDAVYSVFLRTVRIRFVPQESYGSTVGVIVLLLLAPYPVAGALLAVVPFRDITPLLTCCAVGALAITLLGFARIDRRLLETPKSSSEVANQPVLGLETVD
jgi:MFS family permease